MWVLRTRRGVALEADLAAVRLERAAVARRRDLEPFPDAGPPRLYVVALHCGEPEVASAALDDAHGQLQLLDHIDRELREAIELLRRILGQREADHLDLIELMPALDAAHVATGAHLLAAEASRVRDVPQRQLLERDRFVAMLRDELRLRRRDQPEVIVVIAIEVLVEMREMRRRDERLLTCHERRVDLGEAGVDLEVDHPGDERALKRCAGAPQVVEARTRELRAARDVQDAKGFAELPMRLRGKGELALRVLANDAVVVLVFPRRHVGPDVVRDPEHELVALLLERAELRVDLLELLSHLAHACLDRICRRAALASLVPLGLEQLLLRAQRAALLVEVQDPIERR